MKTSPLDAVHRSLGARMVPFGGWEMPLSYGEGTVAEHLACRSDAVVFDVSHLGTVRLEGIGAFELIQSTFTNDLTRIEPGRAQYTHLLGDDGSITDDIIVMWVDDARFDVVPNASNTGGVQAAVGGVDVTSERAVLAVQGPNARTKLAPIAPEAAAVKRFAVTTFDWRGVECVASGTGYTGEDGVEVFVPTEVAEDFWSEVLAAGVVPAGLGARDTLRLEAGLPLHGNDLGPGITPLQAGLGWVIGWDTDFVGKDALLAEFESGPSRTLRGLVCEGRRPPRNGNPVRIDGSAVGEITSGNFSPVLERGIALAFLPPDVADGTDVVVDVRGSDVAAVVTKPPFVAS